MKTVKICGEQFNLDSVFSHNLTVPDCVVDKDNKIGSAKGERKFYISSKEEMRKFFDDGEPGQKMRCFVLREDLIKYLNLIQAEYLNPTQQYRRASELSKLWTERLALIQSQPELIWFDMYDQIQIEGERGYVNTSLRKDKKIIAKGEGAGYELIRKIALPLVSYVTIMKLLTPQNNKIYYWRLFADFDEMADRSKALVFTYGKMKKNKADVKVKHRETKRQEAIRQARDGQGKYRDDVLKECWYCPFTHITTPELLIASHIKPWYLSNPSEKIDPKNGFALTPMFDKLFDRGFITFTDDKHLKLSLYLSAHDYNIIGIKDGQRIQDLPLDEKRQEYLDYHRNNIFKKIGDE